MSIIFKWDMWTDEFFFLCQKAGFNTLGEIAAYMQKEGITSQRLYDELNALCFPQLINADEK